MEDLNATPARENDINLTLGELDKATAFVGEEVEILEQQLGRVMSRDVPQEENKERTKDDRVPLSNDILVYVILLDKLGKRLQRIRGRLEL